MVIEEIRADAEAMFPVPALVSGLVGGDLFRGESGRAGYRNGRRDRQEGRRSPVGMVVVTRWS